MKEISLRALLNKMLFRESYEIWVGDYTARAQQINSSLTSSSGTDAWMTAVLKAICADYPDNAHKIFRGKFTPNSVVFFEVMIYNTSTVSNGLPQYCFGTLRQWQSLFWIISTNNYSFSYTAK